jgi:hypothetical protein
MTDNAIEAFIGRLRERPWIEPALVDVIARGLRMAARETAKLSGLVGMKLGVAAAS